MATKKTFQARVLGALPVGFRGKFRGWGFTVRVQYEIDGTAVAQIWNESGDIVAAFTGKNKAEITAGVTRIKAEIMRLETDKEFFSVPSKMSRQLEKDIKLFCENLFEEAAKENNIMKKPSTKKTAANKPSPAQIKAREKFAAAAKSRAKKSKTGTSKTTAKKPATAAKSRTRNAPGYQYGTSSKLYDERKKAQPPGKRTSATGRTYYEYRKNRTDAPGSLSGVTKITLQDIGAELLNLEFEINKMKAQKAAEKSIRAKKEIQAKISVYNAQFKALKAYLNTRAKFV